MSYIGFYNVKQQKNTTTHLHMHSYMYKYSDCNVKITQMTLNDTRDLEEFHSRYMTQMTDTLAVYIHIEELSTCNKTAKKQKRSSHWSIISTKYHMYTLNMIILFGYGHHFK